VPGAYPPFDLVGDCAHCCVSGGFCPCLVALLLGCRSGVVDSSSFWGVLPLSCYIVMVLKCRSHFVREMYALTSLCASFLLVNWLGAYSLAPFVRSVRHVALRSPRVSGYIVRTV